MRFISILLCVFGVVSFAYGDVLVQKDNQDMFMTIRIQGQITKSDFTALIDKASGKRNVMLLLDSPGGDLGTALKMGMFIRNSRNGKGSNSIRGVMVPENAVCFSSCVFLLAGGIQRIVVGDVGIHRPFSDQDDNITTEKGQKTKYKRLEAAVKNYLKKVNIPVDLYDEMIRIAPSDMRILTETELKHFGLSVDDPYIKEAEVTRFARKEGLTKKQYYEREAEMKRCCIGASSEECNLCVQKANAERPEK